MNVRLARDGSTWACSSGTQKLALRAKLPGAHAFDHAVHGLRQALAAKVAASDVLALAFASSWLVNSAIPSPVFRRWLSSPALEIWSELVPTLAEGSWADLAEADRATLSDALGALAQDGQGAGAISKVLASLAPEAVPLMPDAALAFALGSVARSENVDAQTAGIEAFFPMMDWFTGATRLHRDALSSLGRPEGPPLSAAQILDRLLWFDSAGFRHFKGYCWVKDGDREGVVFVATEGRPTAEAIDLAKAPPAFRDEARRALDAP